MDDPGGAVEGGKPRLPDGVRSFQEMVPITLDAIDDPQTAPEEAARCFGERYGFLLALEDAFKQKEGRAPDVQRMFELAGGLVAGAKRLLQDAWLDRSKPAALEELVALVEGWHREGLPAGDPFASADAEILAIDRDPDRGRAAARFAGLWARLHTAAAVLPEVRTSLPSSQWPVLDALARSAARWRLEIESAWGTRIFEELLGEPTIAELIFLLFPMPGAGAP